MTNNPRYRIVRNGDYFMAQKRRRFLWWRWWSTLPAIPPGLAPDWREPNIYRGAAEAQEAMARHEARERLFVRTEWQPVDDED